MAWHGLTKGIPNESRHLIGHALEKFVELRYRATSASCRGWCSQAEITNVGVSMEEADSPLDICARLRQQRRSRSDEAILTELRAMLPLPHERDPGWLRDWRTEPLWHRGYLFEVLAAEVCRRKLKDGVPLLLERACCGDPGEMFRSLPDYLCQTAQPDWDYLLEACVRAIGSAHAGARLWAVETLGMLRHENPAKVRTVETVSKPL